MPKTWRATNYVEPVSDSIAEQIGNASNYAVVSGCAPSYSGAGLTVTVAAGTVRHNGTNISVASASITLIPDATYPLWAWVSVQSTGVPTVTHGTAAANPSVPEYGDNVPISLILVEANQTIAASCGVKMDKRIFSPSLVTLTSGTASASLTADASTTSTIASITDLAIPVTAGASYMIRGLIHYKVSSAGYIFSIAAPDGSTMAITYQCLNSAGTEQITPAFTSPTRAYATGVAQGLGVTTQSVIAINGTLTVGSTSGTLQYKHAGYEGGKTLAKSRLELY